MSLSSFCFLLYTLTVAISLRSCIGTENIGTENIGTENGTRIVRIRDGGLFRGIKEKSLSGRKFYSFMSIPYAEPPVGKLRFKDPVPAKPWEGILEASKMPVECLQIGFIDAIAGPRETLTLRGKEDCLYLNIYTNSPNEPEKKLPVMVFIHGGAFMRGGAKEYHPYVLMETDVVLVVLQYRLGIFGFLSTEDSVIPGNFGLKDQQLALKWIKKNIAPFGGDPDSITIFGESAGGASVHYQVLSPGSKGLFNRAIIQSGSAFCAWASNTNHRKFAIETGRQFNCSIDHGTEEFLECMQNVNALYLLITASSTPIMQISPYYVLPRVDGKFISKAPEILMKEGKYNQVDIMAGITRDEGALILLVNHLNPSLQERINEDFEKYGPHSLTIPDEENAASLARQIYQHYLKREDITIQESDNNKILRMHTDHYFAEPHDATARLFAKGDKDLYLYQLDHYSQTSFLDPIPSFDRSNLISHADDLVYLFEGGPIFAKPMKNKEDLRLRETILSLWINFAKSGNPNSPDFDFVWKRATEKSIRHLSLRSHPHMKDDTFKSQRKFWSSLKTRRNSNLQEKNEEALSKQEL